jgi:hypothetical protein
MKQETLEKAVELYFRRKCDKNKTLYKAAKFGTKWQQKQDNTANEILEYILLNDDGVGIALGYNSREMIEQYFKRINYGKSK